MMLPLALGTLLLAASAPIMGLAAQPGQVAVPRVELLGWGVTGWREEPPRSGVPAGSRPQDWRRRATAMHEWLWSPQALALGVRRESVSYRSRWFNGTGFGIPDYMGDARYGSGPGSALTVIGTLLSASLLGLPLPRDEFVQSSRAYLAPNGVAMDNPPGMAIPSVGTYWYTLVNQAFFAALSARLPQLDPDHSLLRLAADTWHGAAQAMGGDFDHTGFDFVKMQPVDNKLWKEPDSAGGIAFISVLAHHHTQSPTHLATAKMALDFLEGRQASPLYEMMLPFGAYSAARLNAIQGNASRAHAYDVQKLVAWTL